MWNWWSLQKLVYCIYPFGFACSRDVVTSLHVHEHNVTLGLDPNDSITPSRSFKLLFLVFQIM